MRNHGTGPCAAATCKPVYSSSRGIAAPASDLTISVAPFYPFLAVTAGATAKFTVAVSDLSGFSGGDVTLTGSGLPRGATAGFSPNPVSPGTSSTLSVVTRTSTPQAHSPVT